jgi:hypothetical protein
MSMPLAAGPFLPPMPNISERHLELPSDFFHGVRDRYRRGIRTHRAGLTAAQVHGDSMIDLDICHKDVGIFQRSGFHYLEHGRVVVIEKLGEEEGTASLALKKLVIEKPLAFSRNECDDDINWDDPVIVLRSFNPRVSPWRLAPAKYRVYGVLLRCVRPTTRSSWIPTPFARWLQVKIGGFGAIDFRIQHLRHEILNIVRNYFVVPEWRSDPCHPEPRRGEGSAVRAGLKQIPRSALEELNS